VHVDLVGSGPALSVNPTTLTPSVSLGSNATSQSFTVSNSGTGSVSYAISTNQAWLSVSPTSGVSSGELDTIAVSYSTSLLSTGTYNAVITVTSTNASDSPQMVNVTLTVNPTNGFTSVYKNMTVAGTFVANGTNWNQSVTNMMLIANDTWQGDVNIGTGSNIQFKLVANNNWSTNWGGTTTAQAFPMSGTGVFNANTNILGSGTYNGTYQFTFHDDTKAYTVTPYIASPYAAIYLPGTYQVPNAWSPSNNVMTLIGNNLWQETIVFTNYSGLQFKFAANGTWDGNWGYTNGEQTSFSVPLSGTAAPNSPHTNIVVSSVLNGSYTFTFNDATYAYSVVGQVVDSVGDGIPDAWRAEYFSNQPAGNTNGTMTNHLSCATCDADGTGQNNLFKYLAGLDPTDPTSIFMITSVQPVGANNLVSFTSVRDNVYLLQATTLDLVNSNGWTTVTNNIPGNSGIVQVIDPGGATQTQRIYRAVLQQSPNQIQ
jgi:hypothetical protein